MKDTLCNDILNLHHTRWKDGIQSYCIMAVRHRLGESNKAADALSHMYTGRERTANDGSMWLVCEDWETARGIINDLFGIYTDKVISLLYERFTDEPLFLEVVQAIVNCNDHKTEQERNHARHRAEGYHIEDGKLWQITDGKSIRAKPRTECVSQTEAIEMAKHEHNSNRHWGHDLTKLQLMDRIYSPQLDQSITIVLLACPQCKNFGSSHLHSLLYPITCWHPFKLLVADYLSLPKGKGGYHSVLLVLDTYSWYTWGFKFKTSGTAKTTLDGLKAITHVFCTPETFMMDGGSHFNNGDVRTWCEAQGTTYHIVTAYTLWINGLVENANGKLLGQLKCLCSPGLSKDDYEHVKSKDIAKAWPDHFDTAICQLNEQIIPLLQFSPKELLLGFVMNTARTPPTMLMSEPTQHDVNVQMAYIDQQRLDETNHMVLHAVKQKAVFDHKVQHTNTGEVVFTQDQLVQVYNNSLNTTLSTTCKLLPQWSAPCHIIQQAGNSYTLQTLEGFPVPGWVHTRCLHEFIPCRGTNLAIEEDERGTGERRHKDK